MITTSNASTTHRRASRPYLIRAPLLGAMAGQQRKGRPHKGDRDLLVTRPHRRVGDAVRASAESQGYASISEYVAAVLAEHEGLAELAPEPVKNTSQEELPLATSA